MINDLGNTVKMNEEKHTVETKRAWIRESDKLILFRWIEDMTLYEEEERRFWERIKLFG